MTDSDARATRHARLETVAGGLALAVAIAVYFHSSPGALGYLRKGYSYATTLSMHSGFAFLGETLLHHVRSLLVFAGLVSSSFLLGRYARRNNGPHHTLLDFVVSFAVGFVILIVLFYLLALSGCLYAPVLAAIVVGPLIMFLLRGQPERSLRTASRRLVDAFANLSHGDRIAAGACALLALLALPWTLSPELSYDALLYHLAVPKKLLLAHRLEVQLNHSFSFHPMYVGYLLAYGHALFAVEVSKLLLWLFGLLNAALVAYAVRRYFGSVGTAWFVAFAYLAMPFVFMEMTRVWIDLAVSFFVLTALLLLLRFEATNQRHDLHLAGLFTGIALGSKYTAVLELAALEVVLLACAWFGARRGRGRWLRDLLVFTLIAGVLLAPLLIRNAVVTGNPVFPLATGIFPTPELLQYDEIADYLGPMQRSDPSLSRFWFQMFFDSPFLECLAGPMPLVGLVALLAAFRRKAPAGQRLLAVYALVHASLFFASKLLVLRYGASLLAVLLILSANFWERTRAAGRWGAALRGLALAFSVYLALWAHAMAGASTGAIEYSLGLRSRADFLRAHLMTTYSDAASFLNRHQDAVRRILLIGDGRAFYHENDFLVDGPYMEYSSIQQIAEDAPDPATIAARLESLGVSHLFVNTKELVRLSSIPFTWSDATLQRYLRFLNQHTAVVYDCHGIVVHELVRDTVAADSDTMIDEPRYYLDRQRSTTVKDTLRLLATIAASPRREEAVLEQLERLVAVAPRSRGALDQAAAYYRRLGHAPRAAELLRRSQQLEPLVRRDPLCPEPQP